jgi:hypothetical protein
VKFLLKNGEKSANSAKFFSLKITTSFMPWAEISFSVHSFFSFVGRAAQPTQYKKKQAKIVKYREVFG